ncbi:MAG: hypothetical protein JXB38_01655, partial [Anaerolineales bacterium]|nr:hypothetical protein [Anaerolineales bacterium]
INTLRRLRRLSFAQVDFFHQNQVRRPFSHLNCTQIGSRAGQSLEDQQTIMCGLEDILWQRDRSNGKRGG